MTTYTAHSAAIPIAYETAARTAARRYSRGNGPLCAEDDLRQAAFLRLLSDRPPDAVALRCAVTAVLNYVQRHRLRAGARLVLAEAEGPEGRPLDEYDDGHPSPEDAAAAALDAAAALGALRRIPEAEAYALRETVLAGHRRKDVAAALGVTAPCVGSRRDRALARLREVLL